MAMKFQRQVKTPQEIQEINAELNRVACGTALGGRVCDASCRAVCSKCGSTVCACACHSGCEDIPQTLTTDENFPIESKIAPLAFEFKRLKIFEPFWSCEGHNDNSGALWKIPRVWFYCDSVLSVRLLSDVLKDLEIEKYIAVPWLVRLTFTEDDNPGTAFSLEPELTQNPDADLETLQGDILAIAENLYGRMMIKAGILKAKI